MTDIQFITTGDGHRLAYRVDGPANGPALVLSNSIGTSLHMWDGRVMELARTFRVLRYDLRGHGHSDAPVGAYSIDRLGRDVIELLDALGIAQTHFLGLSLGGMVGQWLGIHAPERIGCLILSNTSAHLGPPDVFDARIAALHPVPDMVEVANTFLANWFPPRMVESDDPRLEPFRATLLAMHPGGLAGCFAAVRDVDMRRTVALIQSPTLVIAGKDDTVTLASHGEQIAATVPGARLVVLPAVHLPHVEDPETYMCVVRDFLQENAVPVRSLA